MRKKEEKSPSLFGVLVGGALSALIGVVLGFLYLASFEPKAFADEAERRAYLEERSGTPPSPKDASFLKGARDRGRGWVAKRAELVNGTADTVAFTAAELNSWLESKFRSPEMPPEDERSNVLLVPGTPNVYLPEDGGVHLNMPVRVSLFGMEGKHVVFLEGGFGEGGAPRFSVRELHVNSAPIPGVAGLAGEITQVLLKAFAATEEFATVRESLDGAAAVGNEGGRLVVRLR